MTRTLIPPADYNKTVLSQNFKNNPLKTLLVRSDNTSYYVSGIYFDAENKPFFVNVYSNVKTHTRASGGIELTADDKFYIESD